MNDSFFISGIIPMHFSADGFRILYACITGFLWLVSYIFYNQNYSQKNKAGHSRITGIFTLAAVMGVFFSNNLITTFLFFEVMSLCSYFMVIEDKSPNAMKAGETYLCYAIMGGLAILMGIFLLYYRLGGVNLDFDNLYSASMLLEDRTVLYLPGSLLLFGFGAKAGLFPLHTWVYRAYSASPEPNSALLSGILSKTGIFGIIIISRNLFLQNMEWAFLLLTLASISMLLGGFLALISECFRKTLAFSSVSQIGFIVMAIAFYIILGEAGSGQAIIVLMMNHSAIKLLLFLCAGIVFINTGKSNLDEIRGFGRGKPLFIIVFGIAALGLSAIPLFSGYIGKILLHKNLLEGINVWQQDGMLLFGFLPSGFLQIFDLVFILSSGLTFAYMLKLFIILFLEKGEKKEKWGSSPFTALPLIITSMIPPLFGIFPSILESITGAALGFFGNLNTVYHLQYYSLANLSSLAIPLLFGVFFYVFFIKILGIHKLKRRNVFDLQNLVYYPFLKMLSLVLMFIMRFFSSLPDWLVRLSLKTFLKTRKKTYSPGNFLSAHYALFFPDDKTGGRGSLNTEVIGGFSLNLLLVGGGICLVLVYVFIASLFF